MNARMIMIALFLSGSHWAPAQNGFIAHLDEQQAGRNGRGVSVREVEGGYLLFSAQFVLVPPIKSHIFVRKLDEEGMFVYGHEYLVGDPRDFDIGYIDPVADMDDGSYAALIAEGFSYPSESWLYRFGPDGDTLLRKFVMTFPVEDSVTHAVRQMRTTLDGGFICTGFFHRPGHSTQALLFRLTADGDTLWTRRFGHNGNSHEALNVEQYPDGGFVLAGYRLGQPVQDQSFLIRTDADGVAIWRRNFGNRGVSNLGLTLTADGGIVTWSNYRESGWPNYNYQGMLTHWNSQGSIVWQRKSHYSYNTILSDIETLPDGSFAASGTHNGMGFIAKFSSTGDSLWTRKYNVLSSWHLMYDVEPTSDGGFILTGEALGIPSIDTTFQTNQLTWMVKTDSLGCVIPGCHTVGVQEYAVDLDAQLRVWPNPVARGMPLHVAFDVPEGFSTEGKLRVVLQDALGREVLAEQWGTQPSTAQPPTTQLSTTQLSPGMYYLHLADDRRWLAGRKIIVE